VVEEERLCLRGGNVRRRGDEHAREVRAVGAVRGDVRDERLKRRYHKILLGAREQPDVVCQVRVPDVGPAVCREVDVRLAGTGREDELGRRRGAGTYQYMGSGTGSSGSSYLTFAISLEECS
jgi:hypothetical protein